MEIRKLHVYLVLVLECPWPVCWAVLHKLQGTPTQAHDGVEWRLHGELHRFGGPAQEWNNGSQVWYEHGKMHRVGGPAVTLADGSKMWFEYDLNHRIGGPAMEWADGRNEWWVHGELQRVMDSPLQ